MSDRDGDVDEFAHEPLMNPELEEEIRRIVSEIVVPGAGFESEHEEDQFTDSDNPIDVDDWNQMVDEEMDNHLNVAIDQEEDSDTNSDTDSDNPIDAEYWNGEFDEEMERLGYRDMDTEDFESLENPDWDLESEASDASEGSDMEESEERVWEGTLLVDVVTSDNKRVQVEERYLREVPALSSILSLPSIGKPDLEFLLAGNMTTQKHMQLPVSEKELALVIGWLKIPARGRCGLDIELPVPVQSEDQQNTESDQSGIDGPVDVTDEPDFETETVPHETSGSESGVASREALKIAKIKRHNELVLACKEAKGNFCEMLRKELTLPVMVDQLIQVARSLNLPFFEKFLQERKWLS